MTSTNVPGVCRPHAPHHLAHFQRKQRGEKNAEYSSRCSPTPGFWEPGCSSLTLPKTSNQQSPLFSPPAASVLLPRCRQLPASATCRCRLPHIYKRLPSPRHRRSAERQHKQTKIQKQEQVSSRCAIERSE